MLTRRELVAGGAVALTGEILPPLKKAEAGAFASFMVNSSAILPAWKDLQIGGGGNSIGVEANTDGTLLTWVDVGGAWLGNTSGSLWSQLINGTSFAGATSGTYFTGCYCAASAPSNSSVIYMLWAGWNAGVYVSQNKGATFTQITAITSSISTPNGQTDSSWNRKIAIDPANPGTAYIGIPGGGGIWKVTNYTTAVRLDPGTIPAATSGYGYYGMYFDPTSGTTGGNTNRIVIPVYGTGVYISTNAGSTWASSSGAPTSIASAAMGADGTYYVLLSSDGSIHRLTTGGTWSSILSDHTYQGIAADPNSAGRLVVAHNYGYLNVSTNANAGTPTWQGVAAAGEFFVATGDVPWFGWSFNPNPQIGDLDISAISIDNNGYIWCSCGIGVLYATSIPSSTYTTWTPQSRGIEDLVTNSILWPPGGYPILSCWDRSIWCITNGGTSPQSEYGPNNADPIRFGGCADCAQNNYSFIAAVSGGASIYAAMQIWTATDGGVSNTWTEIANQPYSNPNGSLAVLTSTQMVCVDVYGGTGVYVTANGGASAWTQNPTGLPTNGWTYGGLANARVACRDWVTAGKVYAYNNVNGSAPGVYVSTNYGASWSLAHSGSLSINDNVHPQMNTVPGQAGNLFFTAGQIGSSPNTGANGYFQYSSNGGATWNNVSNTGYIIAEVWAFGFSAAAPGHTYPSILIAGWISTNSGSTYKFSFWRCDNFDAGISSLTWTDMGFDPFGSIDQTSCIAGNPSVYNQWIRGSVNTGFLIFD